VPQRIQQVCDIEARRLLVIVSISQDVVVGETFTTTGGFALSALFITGV